MSIVVHEVRNIPCPPRLAGHECPICSTPFQDGLVNVTGPYFLCETCGTSRERDVTRRLRASRSCLWCRYRQCQTAMLDRIGDWLIGVR